MSEKIDWEKEFKKVFQMVPTGLNLHNKSIRNAVELDLENVNKYMSKILLKAKELE